MSKSNIVPISRDQEAKHESPNRLSFTLEEMLKEFDNGAVPRCKYWRELITALYDTANHVVTGVTSVADVRPDNVGNIPLLPKDIDAPAMVRMDGADERERHSTENVFGRQLFYGDACKLVPKYGHYYEVLAGPAYVAGIKFSYHGMQELLIDEEELPTSVWLDVSMKGSAISDIQPVVDVIVTDKKLEDYLKDGNNHYVEMITTLEEGGLIKDLRNSTSNFNAIRVDQIQSITHMTIAKAVSDNNTNRYYIRVGDRGNAEYIRAFDDIEFDSFPSNGRFIDNSLIKWVLIIRDVMSLELFGQNEGSDIVDVMNFLIPRSKFISVDKSYSVNNAIFMHDDTTIDFQGNAFIGNGGNGVIRMFFGASVDNDIGGYDATKNVTFRNGILDKNGRNTTRDNGTIGSFYHMTNVRFENMIFKSVKNDHAFEIAACNNVVFEGCEFYDYVRGVRNDVEWIQIESTTSKDGAPAYPPWDDTPSKNIIINNCRFGRDTDIEKVPVAAGHHSNPDASTICNIVFSNNDVLNCTLGAFRVYGRMRNVKIHGNTFINCTGIIIHGHTASGTSPEHVSFYDNDFIGGHVAENTYNAMCQVDGADVNKARFISIYGNSGDLSASSRFVLIDKTENISVYDNHITGSTICISARRARYINIHDNNLQNVSSNFIVMDWLDDNPTNRATHIKITNNYFAECTGDSGVFCRAANTILISGNTILRLDNRGIHLTEETTMFQITDNYIGTWARSAPENNSGIYCVIANEGIITNNWFRSAGKSEWSIDVSNLATNVNVYNNRTIAGSFGHSKRGTKSYSHMTLNTLENNTYSVSVNDEGEISAKPIDEENI